MDIKSLKPGQTVAAPPTLDDQLKSASKMYEKQFLEEMMRAMKKTVSHSDITKPSMAENIYTDEMYSQYAEQWTDTGGNGLADKIYHELKDKILPSQHSRYLPKAENPNQSGSTQSGAQGLGVLKKVVK